MTFIKKEVFILLPLILIGSLVIYFINPDQSSNSQSNDKKQFIPAGCSQDSKNGTSGLFKEIKKIELNDIANIIPGILLNNSSTNQNKEAEEEILTEKQIENNQNTNQENENQNKWSIYDILVEAKKLSLEIELKPENTSDNNDKEWSEKEILATGYSTWEEYSSSPVYISALEYFLENKDTLRNKEDSGSLCAFILSASSGGGSTCSCEGAQGDCYTWVGYVQVFHCGGACCCACCYRCCR